MTPSEECKLAYDSFKQVRNFTKEIPNAIWDIDIVLPDRPKEYTKIANYAKKRKDRKFPYYDRDYIREIDELPNHDQRKKEFLDQEWERRRNGFWFYNGDRLEWVTGHHYMTLQYWLIPIEDLDGGFGNPKFVDMQRDRAYAIWWAKNHPDTTGLAYIGCRRSAKTVDGIAHGYWDTTERYNALFGIQSKTDNDSKGILFKLVGSWQRLPSFWKPVDTGYTTVSRQLLFAEPQKKSSKGEKKEYKEVLNSKIYAYTSTETAMDGERTTFQFQDEFGKRVESDAYKTQQVSKVCCIMTKKVVGFAYWATTVEEMEKGGGFAARKIWRSSNPEKRNMNGRTSSTLVRLFFPSEYGLLEGGFVDEFGYSKIKEASIWLDAEESEKEGSDLLDWRRKFPRTIDDCFAMPTDANEFNHRKIIESIKFAKDLDPIAQPVRGNFMWKDGIRDSEVVFHPNPKGRWLVAWTPDEEDRNRKEFRDGHWRPTRDHCRTGADPFAHAAVTEEGSNAACYTILKSHYKFPAMKMAWVCQYIARPPHPDEAAEDMILQCVFYSSPFLCEKNIYGALQHFKTRGYDHYCLFNPLDPNSAEKRGKGHRGMPMTSSDAIEAVCNILQAHIEDHIGFREDTQSYGFCPFIELLEDWLNFDPTKRTRFDPSMAAAMTLIACINPKVKTEHKFSSKDFLPNYKQDGVLSRRVK